MLLMIASVVTAIILIFITTLQLLLVKNNRKLKDYPGPKLLPIVGNALSFIRSPSENFKWLIKQQKKYGGSFKLFFGPIPVILTCDPKIIEYLLTSTKHLKKNFPYDYLIPWLGTGLLISDGSKWKQRRKILTPAFHFKILEQFVDVFNSSSRIFIKKLSNELNAAEFDIYPYITLNALDIICETAMGTSINAQLNSESEYVKAVKTMGALFERRLFSSWKGFEFLYAFTSDKQKSDASVKILHAMTNSVIKTRRAEIEGKTKKQEEEKEEVYGGKKKLAFLDILLQSTTDGNHLSDADIREEVDTFMFAGHDTISTAVGFTTYLLANNPDVQDKLFTELNELFGSDKNKDPSFGDLQNMKYLDLVIKESMRLYPPAPFIGRYIKEAAQIGDLSIPKNTNVTMTVYMMHHNPDYFPEPEKFKPERFIDEIGTNPYLYIPFSAGPRNCLGQKFALLEMKTTISHLIRNYELLPAGSDKAVIIAPAITLASLNGVHVKLVSRKYPK